ncbi:MAG: hypothetical protein ACC642_03905 [Pseudomonadales bacterium]
MGIRKNRAELEIKRREALRDRIRTLDHLDRIDQLSVILDHGWELQTDPVTGQEVRLLLDNARRQQIDSAISAKMKLVDKVLPVLKAEEITGAGGADLDVNRSMPVLELRNRLRAILTGDSLPGVLENIEHDPEHEEQQHYDFLL